MNYRKHLLIIGILATFIGVMTFILRNDVETQVYANTGMWPLFMIFGPIIIGLSRLIRKEEEKK